MKHSWNYNQIPITCPICNKLFTVSKSHLNKRRCCSTKCAGIFKTNKYLDAVKNQTEKKCYRCKRILPLDHFTKHSQKPDGLFPYCKDCHVASNKKWRKTNSVNYNKQQRDKKRKIRIGDIYGVKDKRKYPADELCELCKQHNRLVYHHWDDTNFALGMWICQKCHNAAHWLETYDPDEFYSLKTEITGEVFSK